MPKTSELQPITKCQAAVDILKNAFYYTNRGSKDFWHSDEEGRREIMQDLSNKLDWILEDPQKCILLQGTLERIFQSERFTTRFTRDVAVVKSRFGYDDGSPKTARETGLEFGIGPSRVLQIEHRILYMLGSPRGSSRREFESFIPL